MGKAPAFQFYPHDWARDLEEHPLEIEGAWIRIICKLWWSEKKGELSKTVTQWARIIRVNEGDTIRILAYINDEGIGNVLGINGVGDVTNVTKKTDTVTLGHKKVTVINRRMSQEQKNKDNSKLRKRRQRSRAASHKNVTTPSSTASATSRAFNKLKAENEPKFSDHFNQKIEQKEILEKIISSCRTVEDFKLESGVFSDFSPFEFVQWSVKKSYHPGAILEALKSIIAKWSKIDDCWKWGPSVVKSKSQYFNERDHVKEAKEFKDIWTDDPNIQGLLERIGG